MSTSCPTNTTSATRSSSITSRTGTSTPRRPRKKPAKVPESLSLEIDFSHNITFANYHAYRVTRSRAPFPTAVRIYNSSDIHFRNVHVNAESGYATCDNNGCGTFLRLSKFPYENAIEDVTHHLEVREREFAVLDIPGNPQLPRRRMHLPFSLPERGVKKLEDGFFSISGAAVDAAGKLYFVDHHNQRIYSWSENEGLAIERDNPSIPSISPSTNRVTCSCSLRLAPKAPFTPSAQAAPLKNSPC
jgi:hypothetical protein